MYKIGDTVYYYNNTGTIYVWELKLYQKCKIINKAIDHKGDLYYGVHLQNGCQQCWYHEDDFISTFDIRKYKLKNIGKKSREPN